jgi:hypothetical protein
MKSRKPLLIGLFIILAAVVIVARYMENRTSASALLAKNLSLMPVPEARTKMMGLNPSERREVWRIKLKAAQAASGYTNEQLAFLTEVIASLDAMKFDGSGDKEKGAAMVAKASALFGKEQAADLFGTIGYQQAKDKTKPIVIMSGESCDCKTSENFCHAQCIFGGCTGGVGCGWLWSGYCDGLCCNLLRNPCQY